MNELAKLLCRDSFLGFDNWFNELDSIQSDNLKYPPTDIYHENGKTIINMAVAGFTRDKINITLENKKLKIEGEDLKTKKDYSYKGISKKSFKRLYQLGIGTEVEKAELVDGMLTITLKSVEPESEVKRIDLQ